MEEFTIFITFWLGVAPVLTLGLVRLCLRMGRRATFEE